MLSASKDERLTKVEFECLQLIAAGKTTKEIAYMLDVPLKTALTLRREICRRLGVHGTANLIRFAVWNGLLLNDSQPTEFCKGDSKDEQSVVKFGY
jgi:DNA-binding CsgD family transcriptional regulator